MNIRHDVLMIKLVEEAAEVIVAASKCQLFGFTFDPVKVGIADYGPNDEALAREIGDFLGVVSGLMPHFSPKAVKAMREARRGKLAKIEKWQRIRSHA